MINKILTYNQLYPCDACICIIFYKIFISSCQTDFAANFISYYAVISWFFLLCNAENFNPWFVFNKFFSSKIGSLNIFKVSLNYFWVQGNLFHSFALVISILFLIWFKRQEIYTSYYRKCKVKHLYNKNILGLM